MSWRFLMLRTWLSMSELMRRLWDAQFAPGFSSGRILPPASLTRMLLQRFHAVSIPMLSYTPPSVSITSVVNGGRLRRAGSTEKSPGLNWSRTGESTGGKADDAATASATSLVGLG